MIVTGVPTADPANVLGVAAPPLTWSVNADELAVPPFTILITVSVPDCGGGGGGVFPH